MPERYRNDTRLVVGLEADESPPVKGTTFEVQICQWTLAGAQGHPAFWAMVERIMDKVEHRSLGLRPAEWTDKDVLDTTGPAGWTEVIYEHIRTVTGKPITWHNLTQMREPRLYGDVLVLPIDAFATGVPHSGASRKRSDGTMVMHFFDGAWKYGNG